MILDFRLFLHDFVFVCVCISDPPTVVVGRTCSGSVMEQAQCQLSCETRGGYPVDVTSYVWRFKGKFTDSSEVLSSGAAASSYSIVSPSYSDAGDYTCHVTHAAGNVSSDPETVEVSCK